MLFDLFQKLNHWRKLIQTLFSPQDLKAFNYYYWFAYPCPSEPHFKKIGKSIPISQTFDETLLKSLNESYFSLANEQRAFFIAQAHPHNNSITIDPLSAKIDAQKKDENFADADLDSIYFCFSDPCADNEYSGWPLRLFLLALIHLWYIHYFIKILICKLICQL